MLVRRVVIGLLALSFAALTTWAVVGLDEAASKALFGRTPDSGAAASPSGRPTPSPSRRTASPEAVPTPTATPRTPAPTTRPTPRPTPSARPESSPPEVMKAKVVTPRKEEAAKTGRNGRTVYLTFDDGPSPYTHQVLRILRSTGSTATFFQLGVHARGQGRVKAAIRKQGSNIGNHSFNHPDLTRLSPGQVRWQIANGPRSRCFRPPFGATNPAVRQAIARAGARQVLWTVDTLDWTKPGVGRLQYIGHSALVRDGAIILMHDGGGAREQTVAALPQLIKNLKARGFKVRALPYCG